jgi:hypothetical protein
MKNRRQSVDNEATRHRISTTEGNFNEGNHQMNTIEKRIHRKCEKAQGNERMRQVRSRAGDKNGIM